MTLQHRPIRLRALAALLLLAACAHGGAAHGQEGAHIRPEALRAHMEFLADDVVAGEPVSTVTPLEGSGLCERAIPSGRWRCYVQAG